MRIRIEEAAFARMTPYWQNLGFPFDALVPSLATAIGSSSDRPSALAGLMGIILNDGVRLPSVRITRMRFAAETPYETVLVHSPSVNQQVMHPTVARTLRAVLSDVVQRGTAQRLADTFVLPDGSRIAAGGKTGSGDNRYNARASVPDRTATFVFYIGNKYFGVVTAYVKGPATEKYKFTSARSDVPQDVLSAIDGKAFAVGNFLSGLDARLSGGSCRSKERKKHRSSTLRCPPSAAADEVSSNY